MSTTKFYFSDIVKVLTADSSLKTEVKLWFLVFICEDQALIKYRDDIRLPHQLSEMDMFLARHNITNIEKVPVCKCSDCDKRLYDAIPRVLKRCTGCNSAACAVVFSMRNAYWERHHGSRYSAPCKCCGVTINKNQFSAAHKIPVKYGGKADIDNIVPTCKSCNAAMGATDLDVYAEELVRIRNMVAAVPEIIAEVESLWLEFVNLPKRNLSG